ncbi:autophagy-related protein 18 [Trichomonascus vanleenenianus]|uniref:autophagy-related protein 18 n=1 Tax=Trichomonascus vanleenenianus TaxID=2268995 RepID=UPI003ECAA3C7
MEGGSPCAPSTTVIKQAAMAFQQDAINFVNFNQDFSCISVGTKNGYKIYKCEPFGKCFFNADGGIGIVEMLFCTSLVAVVGMGDQPALSPRRLRIMNTKRQNTICELTFPTAVLKVLLNRKRLVVLLEEQIYIYDISNMKLLHTIEMASPNPGAICALSPSSEMCYLVYPSATPQLASLSMPAHAPAAPTPQPSRTGEVTIFDALTLQPVNVVEAHKSPLSVLSLSSDGSLLATASDKGTIIRIFAVPSGRKLYQFRRGTYPSRVFSINFSLSASLLAVSSATETIHIFKLRPTGEPSPEPDGATGTDDTVMPKLNSSSSPENLDAYVEGKRSSGVVAGILRRSSQSLGRQVAGAVGGYLPNAVAEMWEPKERDFAYVKLPAPAGTKSVVALSGSGSSAYVVTSEGYFYQYAIDMVRGGECELTKQYSLLDNSDESS